MMPEPQDVEPTRGIDKFSSVVLPFAVASEQCREAIEKAHEILRLAGCALHVCAFRDDLVKHPDTALHFMEHNRQIQTGHSRGKKRFLHTPVVVFYLNYIVLEFLPHALSFELAPQFLNRLLDSLDCRIAWFFRKPSHTLLVNLTFSLKRGKNTEDDAAQLKTSFVFNKALTVGLLNQAR